MILTNQMGLPEPFVDAASSDYQYKPKRYSATAVLKGVREAILQRRHDAEIEQDVSDMVWAIFGTAVHSILEGSQETDHQLKENKIAVDMPNGYQLSGIFDLYDDSTGTVTDYKTASVWKVKFGEFEDWRRQTLIYCWMLRKIGFDAHRGQIVAMLKDHSKTKARTDSTYPQHPVFTISWDFTEEDLQGIGDWLTERFEQIADAERMPDDSLPMCTEEERWAKPSKYAVMKRGRKSAIRLYDTKEEADERCAQENASASGNPFYVEFRKGEDGKCGEYCAAHEFCSYWRYHVREA